jgi:hypothetical protein
MAGADCLIAADAISSALSTWGTVRAARTNPLAGSAL